MFQLGFFMGHFGGLGHLGRAGWGLGPTSQEGVERTSGAWGDAVRIGQAKGVVGDKGVAVTTISLTCTSLVEHLDSVTVWAGR